MTIIATLLLASWTACAGGEPKTHTVVKGDHLWGLAGSYYGNNFRWQAIYAANQDKIKDPHWIYPGQVLTIPDVPGPEIGELPARPIPENAAAAAKPPEPELEGDENPADADAVQPKTQASSEPPPALTDDLSTKMPAGLAGQYPSMTRVEEGSDWKEDGRVAEFDGREMIAATGDWVVARLSAPASAGDAFEVYRKGGPQELDEHPKALHLQRVGRVQVKESLGKDRYRLLIVKSVDSVQVGDLLKKEGGR